MTRMLVSVRSVDEALEAAAGGADLVDLKEPRHGALGALPLPTVDAVVAVLSVRHRLLPISATIGDDAGAEADLPARVEALACRGVDYVKVGVGPGAAGRTALARLAALARPVVPVLLCDDGLEAGLVALACAGPYVAVMLDTAGKTAGGSLVERVDAASLQRFVEAVHACGKAAGLAGALRHEHVGRIVALGPDFAGFRSAVCEGGRSGRLVASKVRSLARLLHVEPAVDASAPA